MTIVELAKDLGVSTATVSRAFTPDSRISDASRQRVLKRAADVGFHPNIHARNMVRRSTDMIAFYYDAPRHMDADYYVAELTFGIACEVAATGRPFQIHTVPAGASPEQLAAPICNSSAAGVIVNLYSEWAHALMQAAEQNRVPYIIIDNTRAPGARMLSLGAAIEKASRKAGAYFLRTGRRRPAFMHGIHDGRKLRGFRSGLGSLAASLQEDPGGVNFQSAYAAADRLLSNPTPPDCLYCANDVLAMGAIRAACDRGVSVPEDLAVIGCDDLHMAAYYTPALTTIRLPKFDLGAEAARQVISLIERGKPCPPHPLDCDLILRESA